MHLLDWENSHQDHSKSIIYFPLEIKTHPLGTKCLFTKINKVYIAQSTPKVIFARPNNIEVLAATE